MFDWVLNKLLKLAIKLRGLMLLIKRKIQRITPKKTWKQVSIQSLKTSKCFFDCKQSLKTKRIIWTPSDERHRDLPLPRSNLEYITALSDITKKGHFGLLFLKRIRKMRPRYRCFPVNLLKFLRTCFLLKTSGRLLLPETASY